jgi:opacity protein-like surface antigen
MKFLFVGAAVVVAAWNCGASAQTVGSWYLGQPYIRGDLGGALSPDAHFKSADPAASDALLGPGARLKGGIAGTGAFDVGVGTRITPFLRWDATLTYIPSLKFSGSDNIGAGSVETANVDSLVGMVNTYLDFAGLAPTMFGPFQPYIDGGIGGASNHLDSMGSSLAGGTITGDTNTSFAWGLGAGVGYSLSPNTTLDISYKYLDLGEARTESTDNVGTSVSPLKADLRTNTIMVGLRVGL